MNITIWPPRIQRHRQGQGPCQDQVQAQARGQVQGQGQVTGQGHSQGQRQRQSRGQKYFQFLKRRIQIASLINGK